MSKPPRTWAEARALALTSIEEMTPEELAQIQAGIDADPDNPELTEADFAEMRPSRGPIPDVTDEEEAEIQREIAADPDNPEPTDEDWAQMRPTTAGLRPLGSQPAREVLPPDLYEALTEGGTQSPGPLRFGSLAHLTPPPDDFFDPLEREELALWTGEDLDAPAVGPTTPAMTVLKTDDKVTLTAGDRTVEATVLLASPNGRSLTVEFDGVVLGHVGTMPLLQTPDGTWISLVGGQPVSIERRG